MKNLLHPFFVVIAIVENTEYLPIEGLATFNKATAELSFGADNPVLHQQRVATIKGLSGTGPLRVAAAPNEVISKLIIWCFKIMSAGTGSERKILRIKDIDRECSMCRANRDDNSTGRISGAHLNPSLTIAFAALHHFPGPKSLPTSWLKFQPPYVLHLLSKVFFTPLCLVVLRFLQLAPVKLLPLSSLLLSISCLLSQLLRLIRVLWENWQVLQLELLLCSTFLLLGNHAVAR
ncbi:hypothetical protein L1987_13317 [Smallanthus sonchifolius]|uniref:Uncharacterized protein n=1 Tax=Smallanthus sonchifolius TaxID=185202 RepID=A0ACB9JHR1_9ASTR|nr:hypothetical protein L1987_13317 [Smallanthus sonchifolius]